MNRNSFEPKISNNLFQMILNDKETTQFVIRTILAKDDIVVKTVNTTSVSVDVTAEDDNGIQYDIIMYQLNEHTSSSKRELNVMNQAILINNDKPMLVYDIVFMDRDYHKKGLPIYTVSWRINETSEVVVNLPHTVYVNMDYTDESSNIGKLIHDFRCTDPQDMYHEVLRQRAKHILG